MTYTEGDIVSPLELIVPDKGTGGDYSGAVTRPMTLSGANMFLSGAAIWYIQGSVYAEISTV